jgi:hypothetical protein
VSEIARIRSVWGNFKGAPGYTNFYSNDVVAPSTMRDAVVAFWAAMQPSLPAGVTVTTEPTGPVIDAATGDLTGVWASGTTQMATGSDAGQYAAPVGMVIRWNTASFIDSRRVIGRTFIVPLGNGNFDADGSLANTLVSGTLTKAAALISAASGDFTIWHRPHPGQDDGHACDVINAFIPDKTVVLRSRRD